MSKNNAFPRTAARWLKTFAVAALATSTIGLAQAATDKPLKLGTTAAFVPALEVAVQEAAAQGVKVELVEFTDWNTPNITVAKGDIDANYFQHIPFLENANKAGGFNLVPVAIGIINNVGLYSKKHNALADIPVGAKVAIAGDAVNGARGLQLLEKAGLIKLKAGTGYKTTQADIVDSDWKRPYSRQRAVLPLPYVAENKFWPSVNRVDDVHGDRHLFCSCIPIDAVDAEEEATS